MKKRLLLILAIGIAFAPPLAFADIGSYNAPNRQDPTEAGSMFCDSGVDKLAQKKGQGSATVVDNNGGDSGSGGSTAAQTD